MSRIFIVDAFQKKRTLIIRERLLVCITMIVTGKSRNILCNWKIEEYFMLTLLEKINIMN